MIIRIPTKIPRQGLSLNREHRLRISSPIFPAPDAKRRGRGKWRLKRVQTILLNGNTYGVSEFGNMQIVIIKACNVLKINIVYSLIGRMAAWGTKGKRTSVATPSPRHPPRILLAPSSHHPRILTFRKAGGSLFGGRREYVKNTLSFIITSGIFVLFEKLCIFVVTSRSGKERR